MRVSPILVLFFVTGLAGPAWARDLSYAVPETNVCPSREDVAKRLDDEMPDGRATAIDVRAAGKAYVGNIVLGAGDAQLARSFSGRTCKAVIDALVLVAALDHAPEAEPPPPAPAPSPVTTEPDLPAREVPRVRPVFDVGLGVGAGHLFAYRGSSLDASVFADLTPSEPLYAGMRPSVRIAFDHTLPPGFDNWSFTLNRVAVDACPLAFEVFGSHVSGAACVRGELGNTSVHSTTTSADHLWASVGAIARLRATFGKPDSAWPFVEIGGGVMRALANDDSLPSPTLQTEGFTSASFSAPEPSPYLWTASLGAGVVFR